MPERPSILVILTDQLRYPPAYEAEAVASYREQATPAQGWLRENGISFTRHYPMSAACAPSRASLLTGHYPPLHGVTQTDGMSKAADGPEVSWLAPDGVPTIGDWFRAAGYRTFYKGKWHATHAVLASEEDGEPLLSINDKGEPIPENIAQYLEADLLDDYGFSEWVGPEPHGLGKHNTGTVKDPFTADETIELLARLDEGDSEDPWLTVCSFLNPHDDSLFGVVGLTQGQRYRNLDVPEVPRAPTHEEDLSTKPSCHQAYADQWGSILAPQVWTKSHLQFYYELQARVDAEISRVLEALRSSPAYENTIIVFSSDHGDMQGAHGGMHEKWHTAYDEALRVPFVIAGHSLPAGERAVSGPTSHADLLPTLLGLAEIDADETLERLREGHTEARPLVGRDLSGVVRSADSAGLAGPVLFMTDDEISEGNATPASPFQRAARAVRRFSVIPQPNHVETVVAEIDVGGAPHTIKFSRYHDNQQHWTVPGERDERLQGRKTLTVTDPEPDEFELYDLTLDPFEERNLAHPAHRNEETRALEAQMLGLLIEQLSEKRLTPAGGERPGYRPPELV